MVCCGSPPKGAVGPSAHPARHGAGKGVSGRGCYGLHRAEHPRLFDRDGGLSWCPLSRTCPQSTGARDKAHACRVRSALRQIKQERLRRRGRELLKLCSGLRCAFFLSRAKPQLDLQALHRVRDRWMGRRTAVINQIRGFLLEHGIPVPAGPAHLKRQIPSILEDADNLLPLRMRTLLIEIRDEWGKLEQQIEEVDREFAQKAKGEENCRRLLTIPGIGPLTATALTAAIGNGTAFHKSRGLGSLARSRSAPAFNSRQSKTSRHQQTWQPLSKKAFHPWRSSGDCSREARKSQVWQLD